jgi:hypothetical protein
MTDPTGPHRPAPPAPLPPSPQYAPAYEVEYVVVSPPLVPVPGTPAPRYDGAPTAGAPAPTGRPRAGTAAAVLAFVEAGLLVLGTLLAAVLVAAGDGGAAGTPAVLAAVAACAVAALGTLGALGLLRGTGRLLLTATTWAGLALVAALTAWGVTHLAADGSGATAAGALLAGVAVLALPVVRLVLLARPEVRAWAPAALGPASARTSPGRLAAVTGPAGVIAVVAALVIGTAGTTTGDLPVGDPYAAGTVGSGSYSGSSDWGRYYRGGAALPAPPPGSRLFDTAYDDDARDCADGDMDSCDELYWNTPVGAFYEWFGSSCAGRVDHELSGGCVDELGAFVD